MKAKFRELDSSESLDELIASSKERPIVVFKHSRTCSISRRVYNEVSNVDATVNLITVQHSRDVSNAVEQLTGIKHESPQALVVRNGSVVYHASHFDIDPKEIVKHLS
ncbi:MAG: bacillithiol system redox-active protein YtxJ [Pyrinomonadaceae bacterium]|nr:bacillithiol system redox-active protein YtxJ [Pyrinomonadaceae bacterium]